MHSSNSKIKQIKELLGQCFSIGFSGLDLPESIRKFIKGNNIGGVTLFSNNYQSPAQVAELINEVQTTRDRDQPPLFIAVDHEGGKVQRFREPFTVFPPARIIGNLDSPKIAFDCAHAMGTELRAVGVNIVFAPVLDINTNPNNPVIGDRAFGESEERVTKIGSAYVRGFLKAGIQPVVKHFPGHGDTSKDSHFDLPKISTTLEQLRKREFKPFLKAFRSQCHFVMSAHILTENIEPALPATLSSKILKSILRKELGFDGIIFSDDMEMKAIADHFGPVDAAILALAAGINILLYHTEPFQNEVWEPLLSRLSDSSDSQAMLALEGLQDSAKRVLLAKKNFLAAYCQTDIARIGENIGLTEHSKLIQNLKQST